jgi:cell division protease FtsH
LNDLTKQILLWVALAVILLAIFSQFGMRTGQPATIDYSQFLADVKSHNVDTVTLKGEIIEGKKRSSGEPFVTYNPETSNAALIGLMQSQGVKFRGEPPKQQSVFLQLLISAFPMILIGFGPTSCARCRAPPADAGAMSFGEPARLLGEDQVNITSRRMSQALKKPNKKWSKSSTS